MSKVIITGGTGLVGTRLSALLASKGHSVNILTRSPKKPNEFKWEVDKKFIDEKVFEGADAIIHLAGANVADKRWTDERKKEIIDSRVGAAELLHAYLSKRNHSIQTFISASASGYYGDRGNELLKEDTSNGSGFLEVCKLWEDAADKFSALNIRVCKARTGVVLSEEDGALPKLAAPIKLGIGAYIGDGKQIMPWIHVDDLCNIYIYLLENKNMHGAYNSCAPEPASNRQMSETIARVLHQPFIPFPAPAFVLKLAMGEMSSMLLMSDRCSAEKLLSAGFHFQFPSLSEALKDIFKK